MNEAEQLQILERIPGFVRPSAEWLKGLAVGDSVRLFRVDRDGAVLSSLAIVTDCGTHSMSVRSTEFGDKSVFCIFMKDGGSFGGLGGLSMISPIEPEPKPMRPWWAGT